MFLQEMREKKEKSIFQYKRNKFLNNIFNNIGEIYEDDKNITCVVKQELLEKTKKRDFYKLNLYGISDIFYKEMNYFKLNKNVHYIFEGIVFEKPLMIFSHYCDIAFKNCVFNNTNIKIFYADKITFSDNKYYCDDKVVQDTFLKTNMSAVDEIILDKEKGNLSLELKAKKIIIKNSNITTKDNKDLVLKADNIKIDNSIINGDKLFIETDLLENKNSLLKAKNVVDIANEEKNSEFKSTVSDIISPLILFNGLPMQNNTTKICDDNNKIINSRQKLIQVLVNLRNLCEINIDNEVKQFKRNMEDKDIKILLKK